MKSNRAVRKLSDLNSRFKSSIVINDANYIKLLNNARIKEISPGELVYQPQIAGINNKNELILFISSSTSPVKKEVYQDCYIGAKEDVEALIAEKIIHSYKGSLSRTIFVCKNVISDKWDDISNNTKEKVKNANIRLEYSDLLEELKREKLIEDDFGVDLKLDWAKLTSLKKKYKIDRYFNDD